MYIKIINNSDSWYNQYFNVIKNGDNFICEINDDYFLSFEKFECEKVTKNHEQKRAFWKWKRFKTTFLKHKSIEGSEFIIDKWGTPNIKYKDYSICFFNDSKKWGIFLNNANINLLNNEELHQWLTTI